MRLNINLATQPYEDAQKFFLRWIPSLLLLVALALGLGSKAWTNFRESRTTDRELSEERARIAALEEEKSQADEILDRPENSGPRSQAKLLNALFARKSFSWTGVLADLERILPSGVQVTGIKPYLNNAGRLEFSLSVTTLDRERAIELVRRMEESPHFRRARFREEQARLDTNTSERKIQIEIVADYDPNVGRGQP